MMTDRVMNKIIARVQAIMSGRRQRPRSGTRATDPVINPVIEETASVRRDRPSLDPDGSKTFPEREFDALMAIARVGAWTSGRTVELGLLERYLARHGARWNNGMAPQDDRIVTLTRTGFTGLSLLIMGGPQEKQARVWELLAMEETAWELLAMEERGA